MRRQLKFLNNLAKYFINSFPNNLYFRFIKLFNGDVLIPLYHTVSNSELIHIKYLYKHKNWKQFEEDLAFLSKYYRHYLFFEDNLNKKGSFFLTFDDGLAECYNISKYLKAKNINAIFFLCPNFIDNKDLMYRHKASIILDRYYNSDDKIKVKINNYVNEAFDPWTNNFHEFIISIKYHQRYILDLVAKYLKIDFNEYLDKYKPYLNQAQINEMIDNGFYIGAHSLDHPNYAFLNENEKNEQTIMSIKNLEKIINNKIRFFAFPFSDIDEEISYLIRLKQIANFKFSFGTSAFIKQNSEFHLQRFTPEGVELALDRYLKRLYTKNLFNYIFRNIVR
jgi:peptidoglycan/xylan/chitin deacetylase (PgdA/CDA1 family)